MFSRVVLLLAAIAAALYWQHPEVLRSAGRMLGLLAPLPAGGGAMQLFVLDPCGICDEEAAALQERGVPFERIVVRDNTRDPGYIRFRDAGGTERLPLLVDGAQRYEGFQKHALAGFVAGQRGPTVLTPQERALMQHNFDSAGRPRAVMYSTATCGYCRAARQWFAANNVPWIERDVETDPSAAADFRDLEGHGTPLIFVGYRRIDGYSEEELARVVAAL